MSRNLEEERNMKFVAVKGSPRKGGNSEMMLQKVLEPLNAARWGPELIQVGGKTSADALPVLLTMN
jgi:multimeric flavodoxin WrbA